MKKLKVKIASVALATSMLVPSLAVFASTMTTPSGGYWDYGVGGGSVWSNYYQSSKTHKSTAVGKQSYTSGWVSAGSTSYANTPSKLWGNEAFYDEM